MIGEFRPAREGGGRGAYAHVRVEARPATPGGEAVWAVDPGDQASAQPSRDPELVEAALDGVREAARQIGAGGRDLSIVTPEAPACALRRWRMRRSF